jgi:hypothetical protein
MEMHLNMAFVSLLARIGSVLRLVWWSKYILQSCPRRTGEECHCQALDRAQGRVRSRPRYQIDDLGSKGFVGTFNQ